MRCSREEIGRRRIVEPAVRLTLPISISIAVWNCREFRSGSGSPSVRFSAGQFADDGEEHGGEEDAEEGDAEHSVEDDRAEGLTHLGAGAAGEDEGDHAEDEGEARHEDRAEAEV